MRVSWHWASLLLLCLGDHAVLHTRLLVGQVSPPLPLALRLQLASMSRLPCRCWHRVPFISNFWTCTSLSCATVCNTGSMQVQLQGAALCCGDFPGLGGSNQLPLPPLNAVVLDFPQSHLDPQHDVAGMLGQEVRRSSSN